MNRLGMTAFFAVLMFIMSGTLFGQTAPGQSALGQSLHQSALDTGQLPKMTAFYFAWHGTPSAETRAANSLLALWDDPEFAPARASMIEQIMQGSAESHKANPPLTAEEFSQYASLLDNEFVFGYLLNPNAAKAVASASSSAPTHWNGAFFVYDRTGKEAVLAKLLLRSRSNEKDPAKISTTTIAGITAIKVEHKNDTSYWAEDGKYAFSASEPAVFEQIAAWAKHAKPESALSQVVAYREANELLKGGIAEFFFHFPSIRDLTENSSAGGFRVGPLLQSLKLETVHAIAGHLALEGARTRVQGAILGETDAGTLFDLWDKGSEEPSSWRFVESNTVFYQESRISLLGIYGLVKRALQSTAGAGQQSPMDFVETAIRTRLGMPLPAALGLFTGEFATLQTSRALDPGKQVYVIGIQKKPEVLKLLRTGFGDRMTNERAEGETTFLKISEGGIESSAGTASWKYYHVGVTDDVIVASSRNESVRETLALNKTAVGGSASAPQSWQAARTKFPARLDGSAFVDFQKIDWSAVKERWSEPPGMNKAKARTIRATSPGPFANTLKNLNPEVFPRHLHMSAGASWKDAQGVHFDSWIE